MFMPHGIMSFYFCRGYEYIVSEFVCSEDMSLKIFLFLFISLYLNYISLHNLYDLIKIVYLYN